MTPRQYLLTREWEVGEQEETDVNELPLIKPWTDPVYEQRYGLLAAVITQTHWPTDIDRGPLGEDQHDAVVEGIPVEVTVRIPEWWLRRADNAQRQLDDLAMSLNSPVHLSPEDQDLWIEERAQELGAGDVSRRILAELDAPGPTRTELEGARRFRSFSGRLWGPRR